MKRIFEFLKLEISVIFPFFVGILLVNFPDAVKFISGTDLNLEEIVKNGWNIWTGWIFIVISLIWSFINVFRTRKICIIKVDGFTGDKYSERIFGILGQQKYNSYNIKKVENENEAVEAYNMINYGFKYYSGGDNCDIYCFHGVIDTPLLFFLGTLYGEQKNYIFYRKKHSNKKSFKRLCWCVKKVEPLVEDFIDNKSNELVVRFHTSFKPNENIDSDFANKDILTMMTTDLLKDIVIDRRDVITNKKKLYQWAAQCVDKIRNLCSKKDYKCVHLLLATSTEMTFYLGTQLCQNYDKKIIVYSYDNKKEPEYWWGICPCEKDITKAIIYKEKIINNE